MDLLSQTKDICSGLGLLPEKSKGQNFLVNAKIIREIIYSADLTSMDTVLEIGPGLGSLTQQLVKRASRVVAVELDKKLVVYLNSRFKDVKNLTLVNDDILHWLKQATSPWLKQTYKIIANLPYQITAVLLRQLLTSSKQPKLMILMLQAEVAERICAQPGQMSVLAVMVQYYSQVKIVLSVKKENFWPVPQVDSAVVKFKPKQARPLTTDLEEKFFKLVKIGFSSRRKMLKNNLMNVYQQKMVAEALKRIGLNLKVRAQELTLTDWLNLFLVLGSTK